MRLDKHLRSEVTDMKGKDLTTNTTIATTHPDNTILTAIVKPRNILIVIGLMAVFILSFYLFT